MSGDRWVHLLVGLGVLAGFLAVGRVKWNARVVGLWVPAMALGTWVPDWDLYLGIGYHRSPLTHSALPACLLFWLMRRMGAKLDFFVGFAVGLSSHLLWDIVDYGDVRWISGGNADRMFLLANAVGLLGWAWWMRKRG